MSAFSGLVVAGIQAVTGAGVDPECRVAEEASGFAAGELDGRRGILVAVQNEGRHLDLLEFTRPC